jgi:hypothetical protein
VAGCAQRGERRGVQIVEPGTADGQQGLAEHARNGVTPVLSGITVSTRWPAAALSTAGSPKIKQAK